MKEILYLCTVVAVLFTSVKADLVECPETRLSFYPHPASCAKFVVCRDGEASVLECTDGFHFDSILEFCNLPEYVGCNLDKDASNVDGDDGKEVGNGEGEGETGGDNEVDGGEGEGDNEGYSQENNGDIEVDGDEGSGDDEVDGGEGGSGEDNENNEGESQEGNGDNKVDSEEGNDDTEVDDGEYEDGGGSDGGSGEVPEDGGVDDGVEEGEIGGEDNDEIEGNGSEEDIGGGGDDGQTNEDGTFACPSAGQHWFPHPLLCSQFIECHDGLYTVVDCIDGLHFNPSLGWCDFPENVGCLDSTTPPPTTTEIPNIGGPVGECPALNGPYVDFLIDSKYCDVFYKCNWGTPVRFTCPPPLHFNRELNVCDWPQDAGCTVGEDEDKSGSDDIPIPEDGGEDESVEEGEIGGEDNSEVEGNGSEEDINDGGDDDQTNEDGTLACPSAGQHWFPHPLICSQFIECHDGLYTIVDCIDGLHFNPSLGWCDFPENVGCVDSTTPPPTTTEIPNIGGPVGECPILNGPYVDFLIDSKYCDVFYKCNWGTPVRFTCTPPLHFNRELNVCDWPQDAGCILGK